ncbi:unnamed protein product [Dibothriocephalus latus]|uniref:Receptor ligand binding region domain-containing protein n=1 Tax=Dibothriocephalus latus TaxID=60516 RepID=A0A3P7M4U9_DIBLA|nr:unnamed protein product [Dibothriocephalus latus]
MGIERLILLTFILAVAAGGVEDTTLPSIPLKIMIILAPTRCIPKTLLFNYPASIYQPLDYLHIQVPNWNIDITAYVQRLHIPGCFLQEDNRASTLIKALNRIVEELGNSTGFSVILGPTLGGECPSVSGWIATSGFSDISYHSLYQLNYTCRPENQHRLLTDVVKRRTAHVGASNSPEVCALSLPLRIKTLVRTLGTFLRYNGWSRLSILYEVSSKETFYMALGQNLRSLLSKATSSGLSHIEVLQHGYSIIIGPQSGCDCDFVTDWIRVSGIAAVASDRIFQINFACRMFVFQMDFIVPNALCKQQDVLLPSQMPFFMLASIALPTELTSIVHALGTFL